MLNNKFITVSLLSTLLSTVVFAMSTPLPKNGYTMEEIYNKMCIECHSADGSGNTEKLTPTMRDLSLVEIEEALKEVENENGHIIMEHNREKINEMGMEYGAKDMSEYMYNRFNPTKEVAAEGSQ
ncbi:MAG: hypothetical protein U9N30_03660 [Campylobacterota bacterium]|nr:hypothetical protein [Campylobacterota bacterium]